VGKLIYEAMTGFSAKDDFPRLPRQSAKAMQRLNGVILKACEDELRKRYQSAHELYAALARLR